MRDAFLDDRLRGLLSRLTPPRGIAGNQEAQQAELDALRGAIRNVAPRQGYEDWWPGFEQRFLEAHETRAWPTVKEIHRAAGGGRRDADPVMVRSLEVERVIAAINETGKAPTDCEDASITADLIRQGVADDLRHARFLGLPLSSDQMREALRQRPRRDEWRHHIAVMSRLRGQTVAECEAQERREMSPDQIPA